MFDELGNPITTQFRINTYTTEDQYFPSVAMDYNGNFVITWVSYGQDGSDNGIYARRYDNNANPLGQEFKVNDYTNGDQGENKNCAFSNRKISVNSLTGDFIICWSGEGPTDPSGIYCQKYKANGTPVGQNFQVNTDESLYQRNPDVSMNDSGNYVVVWCTYSPTFGDNITNVRAQRYQWIE